MRVTLGQLFPAGTSVGVYPETERARAAMRQAPTAAPIATELADVLSNVEFTGLEEDTKFYAAGLVDGEWSWVAFSTAPSQSAIFEVEDPEDLPLEILMPEDQTEDAVRVMRGDTVIFRIDAAGNLIRAEDIQNRVSVASKGAAGDGIADDTAEIQAAIDDVVAQGGGIVYFPKGTYKITATLTCSTSGVILLGDTGAVLDFSGIAGVGAGVVPAIEFLGTLGAAKALAVDAAEGSSSARITKGHGYAVGDWVKISMLGTSGTSDRFSVDNLPRGEWVRIQSITGYDATYDTIGFYGLLYDTYVAAKGGQLEKVTWLENNGVIGLHMQGGPDDTKFYNAIDARKTRNFEVRDCTFKFCHYGAVEFYESREWAVRNCRFEDCTMIGYAYGIVVSNCCEDSVISGNHFQRMRHGVTCGGSTGVRGVSRRVAIVGNNMRTADAGIDSHASSEDYLIANNTVCNTGDAFATVHEGIISQGTGAVIANNTVWGTTPNDYGIRWQPGVYGRLTCVIEGNKTRRTSAAGIAVESLAGCSDFGAVSITGNLVATPGKNGIYINGTAQQIAGVAISGNTVDETTAAGFYAIQIRNTIEASVTGNTLRRVASAGGGSSTGGLLLLDSSDVTVSGNVFSTVAGATFGIRGQNSDDVTVTGNRVKGFVTGISTDNNCDNWTVANNNLRTCTTAITLGTGTGHRCMFNQGVTVPNVAAAATVTLPETLDLIQVTGNTGITAINASHPGRSVVLRFSGTPTITEGGTLRMAGNFTPASVDDTLSLVCDGTNWYETARSVN